VLVRTLLAAWRVGSGEMLPERCPCPYC